MKEQVCTDVRHPPFPTLPLVRDVDILEKIYLLLFAKNDKEMRDDFRRQLRYWRDSAVAFGLGVPGLSALLRRSNLVDRRLLKKPAGREI